MTISQTNSKSSKPTIIFLLVICSYTFSLLWGWIPYTHSIIPLIIGWVAGIIICSDFFSTRSFFFFFCYSIVLFLNALLGDRLFPTVFSAFMEVTWILLPALFTYRLQKLGNERMANAIVIMILWMLIVNAIGSFIVDTIFPGSIRALFAETRLTGDSTLQNYYFRFGLSNYALPHAIPMVIPVLIMGLRSHMEKKKKVLLFMSLLACFVLVFLSGATGPLLMAVFALVIAFVTKKKSGIAQKTIIIIFGVVFMFLLSNDVLVLKFLSWFDGLIGGEGYFHSKVLDFESLIIYGESNGDIEAREDYYTSTIYAIIESPLIGVNYATGGHSALFDRWGCLGLVGFLPLVSFIYLQIKQSKRTFKKDFVVFYLEGVLVALMMLTIKAIDRWEMWLFLFTVLPLLTQYIERSEMNNRI